MKARGDVKKFLSFFAQNYWIVCTHCTNIHKVFQVGTKSRRYFFPCGKNVFILTGTMYRRAASVASSAGFFRVRRSRSLTPALTQRSLHCKFQIRNPEIAALRERAHLAPLSGSGFASFLAAFVSPPCKSRNEKCVVTPSIAFPPASAYGYTA